MSDEEYARARAAADAGTTSLHFSTHSAALFARSYMARPTEWVVRPTRAGATLQRITVVQHATHAGGR